VKWRALTDRFEEVHLRRHQWEWVSKDNNWLPVYMYQPVNHITDIWTEWSTGIDGFLPTRDLTECWGARWRRNHAGQRTESSRRMKVVKLILELSSKHLWNTNLALRFLRDQYEQQFKARSFCDYLKVGANRALVMEAARSYPS
jgi:hypothetical protein